MDVSFEVEVFREANKALAERLYAEQSSKKEYLQQLRRIRTILDEAIALLHEYNTTVVGNPTVYLKTHYWLRQHKGESWAWTR